MKNILEIIFWAFLTRTTKKFPSVLVPTFVGGGGGLILHYYCLHLYRQKINYARQSVSPNDGIQMSKFCLSAILYYPLVLVSLCWLLVMDREKIIGEIINNTYNKIIIETSFIIKHFSVYKLSFTDSSGLKFYSSNMSLGKPSKKNK